MSARPNAADIVRALAGRWHGARGMCRCPAHDDCTPSLSIHEGADGKVLVKCFGGCDQERVIHALRVLGLWGGGRNTRPRSDGGDDRSKADIDAERAEWARQIWNRCMRAEGSLVEVYLGGRGIDIPIPADIRFHPCLRHGPTGRELPCMVAAVRDIDGRVVGIHRTFLAHDGRGKAKLQNPKLSLGPVRSNAVHLVPAGRELLIAEGIETGLAVLQASGRPTWAAVSAGNLEVLRLPALPLAAEVLICADRDGNRAGQAAAYRAARRWRNEGRRMRIAVPDEIDSDFCDLLNAEGARR